MVLQNICSNIEGNASINKTPQSLKYSQGSTSHTHEDINDFENDTCIKFSSSFSTKSDLAKNDHNFTFIDSKHSSTNSIVSTSMGTVQVLPVEGNLFNWAFTPEEHFMINLCNVCDEANAPLDLVNKVVAVIPHAQNNSLNMKRNIICSREYFLKHLNKRFHVPSPETINVTIEDVSGNAHVINVIHQNFLLQAMDLIHNNEIWGNEKNCWNS